MCHNGCLSLWMSPFFEEQSYYDTHLQGESEFDEDAYQNNSDLTFEFETPDNFVTPSDKTRMNEI